MTSKEPFVTVVFDPDGDVVSVQFVGEEPVYEPTLYPLKTPPRAEFVGSRPLGEMWFYRKPDGKVGRCVKTGGCGCVCGADMMDVIDMKHTSGGHF